MNENQKKCEHDIQWCPGDGLDGMCKKCDLYVMKPECIAETDKWFRQTFGENTSPYEGDFLTELFRKT